VHRQTLGDMLLAANLIDEVQMQIALAEQKRTSAASARRSSI